MRGSRGGGRPGFKLEAVTLLVTYLRHRPLCPSSTPSPSSVTSGEVGAGAGRRRGDWNSGEISEFRSFGV